MGTLYESIEEHNNNVSRQHQLRTHAADIVHVPQIESVIAQLYVSGYRRRHQSMQTS